MSQGRFRLGSRMDRAARPGYHQAVLTPRRSWFVILLPLLLGACSTALLVDTPYDDDPQPEAGALPDAGLPRDASVPRDASTPRDAGGSDAGPRDAGSVEAGPPPRDSGAGRDIPLNCATDIPDDNFATLLVDDCASRPLLMCGTQSNLNNQLATLMRGCRIPSNVTVGVQISSGGCPALLTYVPRISANVSLCLQTVLETVRLTCPTRCALVGGR